VLWALTSTRLRASAHPVYPCLARLSEPRSLGHLCLSAGSCWYAGSDSREPARLRLVAPRGVPVPLSLDLCPPLPAPMGLVAAAPFDLRPRPAAPVYPMPEHSSASWGQVSTGPFAPACHENRRLTLTWTHLEMNALSAPVSGRSIVSWARASRDLAGLQCLHSAVLHLRLSGLLRLVVCLCSRGLSELWLPAHLSQVGPWWPADPFLRGPAALDLRPRPAAATGWVVPVRLGLPVPRCSAWSRVPLCSA